MKPDIEVRALSRSNQRRTITELRRTRGRGRMEARDVVTLENNERIAEFAPGDTVKVNVWIREGERQRLQSFQGVVLRMRKGGPSSSFTIRRVASGIGVERSFFFHSPNVESVETIRRGIVRRAKLYYLRGLSGKGARIKERTQSGKR